jgi:hypothetical protein
MVSSGMLRRVTLVRTDISDELGASFIRLTRIGELGTTLTVTSNRRTLRRRLRLSYSETSVLTRTTRRNIPEDTNLHTNGNYLGSVSECFCSRVRKLTILIILSVLCCQLPSFPVLLCFLCENPGMYRPRLEF